MAAVGNRDFLLWDLDLLIAELDHKIPWPSSRRRFYQAVLRIYERTDLDSFRGDARELLREELAKDGGKADGACTETDQCFDRAAQERDAKRLGKQDGIPHHAALRKIAEREGFKSWEELSRAASGVSAEDFEQCE